MSKEPANELETGDLGRTPSQISRKRSLVKPERRRLTKDDPNYFYTLATEEGNVSVHPSTTGTDPHIIAHNTRLDPVQDEDDFNLTRGNSTLSRNRSVLSRKSSKRRSNQSKLTREGSTKSRKSHNSQVGSGDNGDEVPLPVNHDLDDDEEWDYDEGPKLPFMPKERNFDPWQLYCKILTCFIPGFVLKVFGLNTPERQMAWREKIGLISVILLCGLFVGYLTFGFTQTVCSNSGTRIHAGNMQSNQLLINGFAYDFGSYDHPAVEGIDADSPILYPPVNAGGKDASFMFQNVNGYCKNVITPKEGTSIPHNSKGEMGWYFPCQLIDISNFSLVDNEDLVTDGAELYEGWGCHSQDSSRTDFYSKKVTATIYYTWDDLWNNRSDPLISYNGDVLDLRYLDFLLKDDVDYPELFDKLRDDESIRGRDISQEMSYGDNRRAINCLREITKVGEIDTDTIGCIASKVVLYISLVFIMGLVVIKFLLACYFRFFISRKQGAFPISEAEFRGREQRIEDWGDDINAPGQQYQMFSPKMQEMQEMNTGNYAPSYAMSSSQFDQTSIAHTDTNASSSYSHVVGAHPIHQRSQSSLRENPFEQPKRRSMFLDKLTNPHVESQRISGVTMSSQNPTSTLSKVVGGHSLQKQPLFRQSIHDRRNTMYEQYGGSSIGGNGSLIGEDISYHGAQPEEIEMQDLPGPGSVNWGNDSQSGVKTPTSFDTNSFAPTGPVGGSTEYLVPQPPLDFQPFGYPLAHVMCMVTAYSESVEGLRTTLDSICTTDYPNSHQLIAIVCDGLVKGSGNDMSTPEICLSMMTDFCQPVDEVKPYSYVSVVSGEKRHNMAKVYAGFYRYDDDTIPPENQQRVPMICIVKCGTPNEANSAKPGNRGKRDSQIILMSFLQRVMFDERMTELEFEIFNGIRSVTGVAPDFYEMLLMVDADTKVFPDCLTHMCAEMVRDPQIMGLCGETKIANKRDSWVTMIQVFEYFISHHQAKAFESVFGGVTCLPGCFSMYRIKAPKGEEGYWVPILCNPDIVERYSDNAINTLHSKNLLLLGEDRFLSTLMLRTFPKRKMMFVPKAACKTIVPDEFKVLLSQRRRWINSTIHNLFELLLVRDLCGVFIISMQFVVFVDLLSTLVLPAALAFTLYVVIIACVKKPVPYLSLILLGMILGLPGLLIVVTATRASYVLWMLVYLAALPVWNFVLPLYAYWKFDDFSWGETRSVEGGNKAHDEAKGEFDSSQIVMKRWREFQEDRLNEQGP